MRKDAKNYLSYYETFRDGNSTLYGKKIFSIQEGKETRLTI